MYSGRGVRDAEPSQSIKPILMKRPSLLLLGLDAEKGADPCMVAADCSHHAPRAHWEVMLETVIMSGGASLEMSAKPHAAPSARAAHRT